MVKGWKGREREEENKMRERHADDMKSMAWIHFFKTPLRTELH